MFLRDSNYSELTRRILDNNRSIAIEDELKSSLLCELSTADLIQELSGRERVSVHDILPDDVCEISYDRIKNQHGVGFLYTTCPRYDGPIKILVVEGGV